MWCGSRSPACPGSFFLGALLQQQPEGRAVPGLEEALLGR
jgi:hypothetical protein